MSSLSSLLPRLPRISLPSRTRVSINRHYTKSGKISYHGQNVGEQQQTEDPDERKRRYRAIELEDERRKRTERQ